MEQEIWNDVVGYEGLYQVSDLGRVRGLDRKENLGGSVYRTRKGRVISGRVNSRGYYQVILSKDAKSKTTTIHQLVARAFHPNPNNLPCVNHKDRIRTNNVKENLEWVTYKQNTQHALDNGFVFADCRIQVIDTANGIIHQSVTDAAKSLGLKRGTLCRYLNGKRPNKTTLQYYKPQTAA